MLVFSILTGALAGQPLTARRTALDASNSEIFARPANTEPIGAGTISVQELRRPVDRNGLRLLDKARENLARGESARGMDQLRAAMRDESVEPYALGILATEHIKRGDFDTAIVELQTAVALQPGIPANHANLAYLLGMRQRNEEALAHARKAVQLEPLRCKTRFLIGQILLQMGRKDEAEFHLRRAAEEVPGARKLLTQYFTHAEQ